jgi:predicted nucleotidyltransferase
MPNDPPSRSDLLSLLQAHQSELTADGVEPITLFGSVARGDAAGGSDVDPAEESGLRPSMRDVIRLEGIHAF